MQFAVLSGDPKKGEYTQMRKVPAGTANPLHTHSSDIKNVIISGVWYTGSDTATARDFGPGSIVMMPGNWMHVSGCRGGSDCVFYKEGKGKFDYRPANHLRYSKVRTKDECPGSVLFAFQNPQKLGDRYLQHMRGSPKCTRIVH